MFWVKYRPHYDRILAVQSLWVFMNAVVLTINPVRDVIYKPYSRTHLEVLELGTMVVG